MAEYTTIEDCAKSFERWFASRYARGGRNPPYKTAWHFFAYMASVRRSDAFMVTVARGFDAVAELIDRKPVPTELMRLYRQDCAKMGVLPDWRNAVRWYFAGKEGMI